jgi:hypothetical protein
MGSGKDRIQNSGVRMQNCGFRIWISDFTSRRQESQYKGSHSKLRTLNPEGRNGVSATPNGERRTANAFFNGAVPQICECVAKEGWLMKFQLLVAGAVVAGLFTLAPDAVAHGGFNGGGGHGGGGRSFHAGGGFHGPGGFHGGFHGGHFGDFRGRHGDFHGPRGFHGGFHGGRFGDFRGRHGDFHGHRRFDHDRFFDSGFGFYGYPYWWDWGYPYYAYDDPYYYPYYYPGSYYGYDAYYGDPYNRTGDARSYSAKVIQTELARRGYYRGPIDGVLGPESRNAIRSFQARNGLPVTGRVDGDLYRALQS